MAEIIKIGRKGTEVILTKTSNKPGAISKAQVGKEQKITLSYSICVGLPIRKFRKPIHPDTPRSLNATSPVLSILFSENNMARATIETAKSFYQIEFYRKPKK